MTQPLLAGAAGARDLGGIRTADGRRVRPGVLVRAPALGRLTDPDVATLGALGLIEVIDLRYGQEIVDSPPDRLPAGPHVAHIPIYDPGHPVFRFTTDLLTGTVTPGSEALHAAGPEAAMVAVYQAFVSSPAVRTGFGTAARRVVAATGRPVLYHCSIGKDRTGWLTAILLGALGVDRATVTADYLRTNQELAEVTAKLVTAAAAKRGVDEALVRPVLAAAPAYLDAAYARAEEEYGSFDGYLRDGLQLTDGDVEALRRDLLE